jgi:two-component system, chemotaxis family, chemotaxis protein CheY
MATASAKVEPLAQGKLKLLICDDSNIIRRKIERELKIDRLQVIATASNGRLAVEAFRKEPADVVTMDITMPEMDGIECVEKLVAIKPDVLILIISALSDKATAIEGLKRGANGFLCKPFTDRQLTDALAELIRGAQP